MTKERVLITGTTGFVASHFVEFVAQQDAEVYGVIRWRSSRENLRGIENLVQLVECDLNDAFSIRRALEETQPDKIFHFAAQSFVPTSWKLPADTLSTNVVGTANLFEAVRSLEMDPRIMLAGSSEEYGLVHPNELPIKETNPLRPLSPYAVSKAAMDLLGFQYHQSYGMKIVRTRAFNHEGPRRGLPFVTSNFAYQIALAETRLQPAKVLVGNLEARRDYTDVRDIVRAYWLALERCKFGEAYNICSGKSWRIGDVLETLRGFARVKFETVQDPTRLRPSDVMLLEGDSSKFRAATGWEPKIPFAKTLEDTLNYWRDVVQRLHVPVPTAKLAAVR